MLMPFIIEHVAWGYSGKSIASKGMALYRDELREAGLPVKRGENSQHDAIVAALRESVSKAVYRLLHRGRKGDAIDPHVAKIAGIRDAVNLRAHAFISNPAAQLAEVSDVVERNRGRHDDLVLRAVALARELCPLTTDNAADMPTQATRTIVDVTHEHAAQCTFIVHKPHKAPEIHKAAQERTR
jgi:hypothetical protein